MVRKTRVVNCPNCEKEVPWTSASTYRPFCSERCRLIDLGDWAAGKHVIAGESVSPAEDLPGDTDEWPID